MTIDRSEVAEALRELVESGLATACLVESGELVEVEGMPPIESLGREDGAWFYMADAGRKVRDEYAGWPWDEEGESRKDWAPPEN